MAAYHRAVQLPGCGADSDAVVMRVADEFAAAQKRWTETIEARGGWDYESPDDRAARHRREDEWLQALRAVDPWVKVGTPAWVTFGMLRQELEAASRLRVAHAHLWDVNQMTGWHLGVAHLAGAIAVDTPAARAAALRRFRALPRTIRARIDDLRYGASEGYTAARRTLQRVVQQIDTLGGGDTLDSAAVRAGDDAFASEWRALIAGEIRPALRGFRDFLVGPYTKSARENGALATLPHGLEVYRAEIFRYTSLDLSPEELLHGAVPVPEREPHVGVEREERVIEPAQPLVDDVDVDPVGADQAGLVADGRDRRAQLGRDRLAVDRQREIGDVARPESHGKTSPVSGSR